MTEFPKAFNQTCPTCGMYSCFEDLGMIKLEKTGASVRVVRCMKCQQGYELETSKDLKPLSCTPDPIAARSGTYLAGQRQGIGCNPQ